MNHESIAYAKHEVSRIVEYEVDLLLAMARTDADHAKLALHPAMKAYHAGACNASRCAAIAIAERHGITIDDWKITVASIAT
jgi:hypothetical protein